jgi:uncharacterized membrane-anchored protein
MRQADRNRIDRLPTTGERWIGIVLSALIALVFVPATIVVLLAWGNARSDRSGLLAIAAVFGVLGGAGLFLFYRVAFTKPRAASARANHVFAYFAVAVSVLMAVLFLATSASVAQRVSAVSLAVAAVGYLVAARRRSLGSRRR